MNELKATIKHVLTVQVRDLEQFVRESYGVDWTFKVSTRSCYEADGFFAYQVNGTVDANLLDWLNRWLNNPSVHIDPDPETVLNDLARRGLIVKGEYLIEDRLIESGQR